MHRRPADDFDGLRKGQRHSCENGMTQKAVELQRDTRRPRPGHPPPTPIRGGGWVVEGRGWRREGGGGRGQEGGGRSEGGRILPKRLKSGSVAIVVQTYVCLPTKGTVL